MTFDMRSRRFWNESDTSWKYPAKIFVRGSIFHRNTIYRSVIIEVNWSPQISAHKEDGVSFSLLFLCASRKTHRQTVIASAVNLLRQKRNKRTLAGLCTIPAGTLGWIGVSSGRWIPSIQLWPQWQISLFSFLRKRSFCLPPLKGIGRLLLPPWSILLQ